MKGTERNWRILERNLRIFVLQRMNLFLWCEEWIKLQHNLKKPVKNKIISHLSLTQSFMILLWMHFRMLSLDAITILLWNCWIGRWKDLVNPLSANPTEWSNTTKQLPTNGLSVSDHFVKFALKGLDVLITFLNVLIYAGRWLKIGKVLSNYQSNPANSVVFEFVIWTKRIRFWNVKKWNKSSS